MVNIPMNTNGPVTKESVLSLNQIKIQAPKSSQNITAINNGGRANCSASSAEQMPVSSGGCKPVPALSNMVQKGQKVPLEASGRLSCMKACLGWNTTNPACDVDVSAFLLNADGKVLGDTWFVFYGQTQSPDGSTDFALDDGADREIITVNFTKINPNVHKIVFVLTINEALEKNLNFSMLKDAYIRLLDQTANREIVSFKMDQYYSNVTSMMIGEVYLHNGLWKFHAIGDGVARDLAGLCELYGVQVI